MNRKQLYKSAIDDGLNKPKSKNKEGNRKSSSTFYNRLVKMANDAQMELIHSDRTLSIHHDRHLLETFEP